MPNFHITERPGHRAEVAQNIRTGCHHALGRHTLLDQAREYAAEQVEHFGKPGDIVGCMIIGQATSVQGAVVRECVSVDVYQCLPGEDEAWDARRAAETKAETETPAEALAGHGAREYDKPEPPVVVI